MAGDEVVQLYIRDLISSRTRPIRELKGFRRIALGPGESQRVTFDVGFDQLSMLDAELRRVVEPGEFRIMIGSSSVDMRLRGFLTVADR
jgi:beta-glucosidase